MSIPICLLHSSPDVLTETFIRAHAERLPARVTVVSMAKGVPCVLGKPVLSQHLFLRGVRECRRYIKGGGECENTLSYIHAFRKTGAKAVLAEYGPAGVDALEACRRLRIPLIVHFHGFDASVRSVLEQLHAGYQRLFRDAAAIVSVSRAMEQRLLDLGAPRSKLFYNPYGVDCDVFAGAAPVKAAPRMLAVGRFVEKKAPHLTLMSFARIAQDYPEVQLRMIGDGPLLGTCKDLAIALGIQDRVAFLGPRSREEVLDEMRRARAFVQHSVEASNGDCEGTPVAILEASATGLPVIATNHAGIPDVVVHEETGLLVGERDVPGMAEAMNRVVVDPRYAGQLGAAGRARVSRHFSVQQSIDSLWSIMLRAMGRPSVNHESPLAVCS